MDGAAFDFLQVDAVLSEGLERGKKRPGAVGQAHGDGHLVGLGRGGRSFGSGAQQKKAGEIFGVVLDAGEENDSAVMFGGAAGGDGGVGFVAAGEGFAHASGRVFGWNALEVRMG